MPSHLLSFFEECVEHGVWASLETYKRRGVVVVNFSCQLLADSSTTRTRNARRTRKWKEQKSQRPSQTPANSTAAAIAENEPPPARRGERSFAEVTASTPVAPTAVRALAPTAAGPKVRAMALNPSKRAKNTLAASRVSQRAALLKKKREAAVEELPVSTPPDAEEPAPEALRGAEDARANDSSLLSSPPTPHPPPPLELTQVCDCDSLCDSSDDKADFHNVLLVDGVGLNTRDPPWQRVFPKYRGRCRFCDSKCEPDDVGQCRTCEPKSIFQLVKQHAPLWRYPRQ